MIFFFFFEEQRKGLYFGRRSTREGIQGNEARHWRAIELRMCLIQNPFLWIRCPLANITAISSVFGPCRGAYCIFIGLP